jgi:biotin-dependent carboxylase-like uncharacterized protein
VIATTARCLRIVQPGFATTVQDHGRFGYAHLGVPSAGPVDRHEHDLVNRLVGNPVDAASIETMGALVVEARSPLIVASSADASRHTLGPGDRLRVDVPDGANWAYLSVRGGVEVAQVLGSRSHDTLGHVGPAPLVAGTDVAIGPDPATPLIAEHAPHRVTADRPIRVWAGPHGDWFDGGLDALVAQTWHMTTEISRVGVRLTHGVFARTGRAETKMQSVGVVEGAIQVTPADEPIVMLANHPTTGGYPVIAVVDPDDVATLAQRRPGAAVVFRAA